VNEFRGKWRALSLENFNEAMRIGVFLHTPNSSPVDTTGYPII
jgi:hypothetical protein